MSEQLSNGKILLKNIRAVLPNRISRRWGLVVPGNSHQVQPIRGGFQFIGGRTWTISFLRIVPEDLTRVYDFYDLHKSSGDDASS